MPFTHFPARGILALGQQACALFIRSGGSLSCRKNGFLFFRARRHTPSGTDFCGVRSGGGCTAGTQVMGIYRKDTCSSPVLSPARHTVSHGHAFPAAGFFLAVGVTWSVCWSYFPRMLVVARSLSASILRFPFLSCHLLFADFFWNTGSRNVIHSGKDLT